MALTKVKAGVMATDSVATASIVNDAVTLAKMASGTDGNLISYDASGNPVAIATGNAGEVLTSAGAGSPPSFQASSGAYTAWATKTTNYTALASDQLKCNHASTPFTITLPSSPSANDTVVISNAGAATVTIGRNGSNINSLAQDGTLVTDTTTQLVYLDSTIGWHEN